VEDHKFHFTESAVTLSSLAARSAPANALVAALAFVALVSVGAVGALVRRRRS